MGIYFTGTGNSLYIAKQIEESNKLYNTDAKPGSIAAKAAMVQKYNEAHEKRK